MPTLKIVLKQKRKTDTTAAPVCIRITHNRKLAYINTGISIRPQYWDTKHERVKKTYPNAYELNEQLRLKLSEVQLQALKLASETQHITAKGLADEITGRNKVTFTQYFKRHISTLEKQAATTTVKNNKTTLSKLTKFAGDEFELTQALIIRWKEHLTHTEGLKETTANSYLNIIRNVCKQAIKDDVLKKNPFAGYNIPKPKRKYKYLTVDEFQRFSEYEANAKLRLYQDVFTFQVLTGLRVSDTLLLEPVNIQGEYLNLVMKKTNEQLILPLVPKALEILQRYANQHEYHQIFPILKTTPEDDSKRIDQRLTTCRSYYNKKLKEIAELAGINKNVTSHVARHTNATILLNKGVDSDVVSELLGHTNKDTVRKYAAMLSSTKREALNKAFNE